MRIFQAFLDYSLFLIVILLALGFGWVTATLCGAGG